MSRVRRFLDIDVLQAANDRLDHIYATFDDIVILFSGGKDSLVCLYLVKQLYERHGITRKVKAAFKDEEIVSPDVLEFIEECRGYDWLDLITFAVQVPATQFIMGKTHEYTQWDENRENFRDKPAGSFEGEPGKVYGQEELDAIVASAGSGKVALITGVRADESLMRYRSVVNKLNENYINQGSTPKHKIVKPIYDWSLDDIFKYIHDFEVPYCTIYDAQVWGRVNLRVSGPLHPEMAKRMPENARVHPEYYARIFKLFPDVATTMRYTKDLDLDAATSAICESWETIEQWIDNNAEGDALRRCRSVIRTVKSMASRQPQSYPLKYVARYFINGQVQSGHCRMIPPFKTR